MRRSKGMVLIYNANYSHYCYGEKRLRGDPMSIVKTGTQNDVHAPVATGNWRVGMGVNYRSKQKTDVRRC
ncbi:hypothetical protein GCM10007205_01940 [Oxalicibacterium flavum]|uniref:Uncharacterized protein n=1 Tax=Oxalicibacterium flavum TaxID=179467 RepID=A0A8J2UM96_9BURK|nr:hypothetical protein [Oxalicibacterium flavum]GGB96282.1 hypothetical protein GCM10007205_01940 [Oxalicibacterium flavum]